MEKPSYLGHRERIKEKFTAEGLKPFLEHEVLELLLTFSVPRKDTKKLAWALLNTFGSLNNVLDADNEALLKVKGIGPQSALLINVIDEIITRHTLWENEEKQGILNQEELYKYVTTYLQDNSKEFFAVLFLDIKLKVIAAEILAEGKIDNNADLIRKFAEFVFKYGAKSVIFVHNYIGDRPLPIQENIETAKHFHNTLKVLTVTIADHIITGAGKLYSLRSRTYLEKPKILL